MLHYFLKSGNNPWEGEIMNFNEVKELIQLINSSELAFFEYETNDDHIKMDKSLNRKSLDICEKEMVKEINTESVKEVGNNISVNVATDSSEIHTQNETNTNDDFAIVTSPMVGTFYSSPSPESENFVIEGSQVKKGDTLCIIEAMKLMNEIESEYNGEIVECLIKDGDMVEYGQPLFKIKEA